MRITTKKRTLKIYFIKNINPIKFSYINNQYVIAIPFTSSKLSGKKILIAYYANNKRNYKIFENRNYIKYENSPYFIDDLGIIFQLTYPKEIAKNDYQYRSAEDCSHSWITEYQDDCITILYNTCNGKTIEISEKGDEENCLDEIVIHANDKDENDWPDPKDDDNLEEEEGGDGPDPDWDYDGSGENNSSDDDQIFNELTGKEKCAYEKLIKLNLFKSTIGKFAKGNYNLILKSWTKDACNNPSDDGCTDAKDLINGNITIYIQNPQQGTLDVAATILHEGIHAELYKYVDEHKKGVDPNNRKNLLEYYFAYKVDNGGNKFATSDAQHQHMADAYVTPIAKALRQLDNYRYPVKDYLSLAWNGLRSYGMKDPSGVEGYFENGKWTTLDNDKSYEGMSKILKNTKFNSDCK